MFLAVHADDFASIFVLFAMIISMLFAIIFMYFIMLDMLVVKCRRSNRSECVIVCCFLWIFLFLLFWTRWNHVLTFQFASTINQ